MKIINPTIINNTNFTELAVESLINDSIFTAPRMSDTQDEVSYMEYVDDVEVREDGVYIPTEYKTSYRGSGSPDDTDEYLIVDFEKKFTREELKAETLKQIQQLELEAYNEFINVMITKN